jgi:hypothetical protein
VTRYADWFGSRYSWTPSQALGERYSIAVKLSLLCDDLTEEAKNQQDRRRMEQLMADPRNRTRY